MNIYQTDNSPIPIRGQDRTDSIDSQILKNQPDQTKKRTTFITCLKDDQVKPHQQIQKQLENLVEGIDQQFKDVMSRHQNDFMNAYHGYMAKVQKELFYLKQKSDEAAGKLLNDDSILRFKKQIDWFKNEATKLDSILDQQKREVQKLKSSEYNLVEDKTFLETQVKESMKHNKLLKIGTQRTKEQSNALREFLGKNQQINRQKMIGGRYLRSAIPNNGKLEYKVQPDIDQEQINIEIGKKQNSSHQKSHKVTQELDIMSQDSQDFRIKDFVMDLFKKGYSKDQIQLKILKFFKAYDLSRDQNIEKLQSKLENKRKQNMKLKNAHAVDFSEKTEVENLFLDCVDECKKEVLRKKTLLHSSNHAEEVNSPTSQAFLEDIVLNKDSLIVAFEEMFGNKQKKTYDTKRNPRLFDNSISYLSNTTKDQSDEQERIHRIMSEPIENLMNNLSNYSQSTTKLGIRKLSSNARNNQRAQTAIHKKQNQLVNETQPNIYQDQYFTQIQQDRERRAQTSHSQHRTQLNKVISLKNDDDNKSRQVQIKQGTSTNERSFSVKNGKLVINKFVA